MMKSKPPKSLFKALVGTYSIILITLLFKNIFYSKFGQFIQKPDFCFGDENHSKICSVAHLASFEGFLAYLEPLF